MSILVVEDAKVWFAGIRAVDGVSLELEAGQLYGLVGPNGSGKTTLVNAISRFTKLTSGTIYFGGRRIDRYRRHELYGAGMARTFQAIRLLDTLTVRENVAIGADRLATEPVSGNVGVGGRSVGHLVRRSRRATRAYVTEESLERVGILDVAEQYPGSLPYGMQRRVEIARALAGRPKLLLLDEPVAGMNRAERHEIAELIRSLRAEGLTQLLIEHDLRLILELCDHLSVMNFGRCIAAGEPQRTAALPIVQEAYLGKRDGAA
jgi:ABC-type branched-subunit amino acid transport system ATPase component